MMRTANKTCQRISDQMLDAYDGALDRTEQRLFQAHLGECPACAKAYGRYVSATNAVSHLEAMRAPDALAFQVMQGINAQKRTARGGIVALPLPRYIGSGMAFAVAACLFVLASMDPMSQATKRQYYGVQHTETGIDYVDATSLQPIQLDMVLHRARETERTVRLTPMLNNLDSHRRGLVEQAVFQNLNRDLQRYGDAGSQVIISEPVYSLEHGVSSAFVVAVDDGF